MEGGLTDGSNSVFNLNFNRRGCNAIGKGAVKGDMRLFSVQRWKTRDTYYMIEVQVRQQDVVVVAWGKMLNTSEP